MSKHWVVIIDKTRHKMSKKDGTDMKDKGDYNESDFSVTPLPDIVDSEFHLSFDRNPGHLRNVDVSNTDISEPSIQVEWKMDVVESDEK